MPMVIIMYNIFYILLLSSVMFLSVVGYSVKTPVRNVKIVIDLFWHESFLTIISAWGLIFERIIIPKV